MTGQDLYEAFVKIQLEIGAVSSSPKHYWFAQDEKNRQAWDCLARKINAQELRVTHGPVTIAYDDRGRRTVNGK